MTGRTLFIAIEGIDGAGKRTQTVRLVQALRAAGVSACWTAFPRYGKTWSGRILSGYLNGQFGPLDSIPVWFPALLFAEDRFESRGMLETLQREHAIVVADRYVASNLAFQGARIPAQKRFDFYAWLSRVEYEANRLPHPDLTVLLDVTVEAGAAQVANKAERGYTDLKADLHERDRPFLERVRDVYSELCALQYGSRWLRVRCMKCDGQVRSIDSIHQEVFTKVSEFWLGQTGADAYSSIEP